MARQTKRKMLADPQPFAIRRSRIQGRGGFATRDIRKGERIAEYEGERISWKEADRRYDDADGKRHHTFLFAVTSRTVIDGAVNGSDARFINHSCDPNCEAIDDRGRIFIEAMRPIAAGDELFYDYAYARDESTTEEDEQLYVCLCGTAKCRGTILEAPPKRKSALPKTHHAAARHPHEHAGSAQGAEPRGSKGRKGSTKKSGRRATRPDTGKRGAGKPAGGTRGVLERGRTRRTAR